MVVMQVRVAREGACAHWARNSRHWYEQLQAVH
jgi:hypothetical protein